MLLQICFIGYSVAAEGLQEAQRECVWWDTISEHSRSRVLGLSSGSTNRRLREQSTVSLLFVLSLSFSYRHHKKEIRYSTLSRLCLRKHLAPSLAPQRLSIFYRPQSEKANEIGLLSNFILIIPHECQELDFQRKSQLEMWLLTSKVRRIPALQTPVNFCWTAGWANEIQSWNSVGVTRRGRREAEGIRWGETEETSVIWRLEDIPNNLFPTHRTPPPPVFRDNESKRGRTRMKESRLFGLKLRRAWWRQAWVCRAMCSPSYCRGHCCFGPVLPPWRNTHWQQGLLMASKPWPKGASRILQSGEGWDGAQCAEVLVPHPSALRRMGESWREELEVFSILSFPREDGETLHLASPSLWKYRGV